ncbi:hypothetical protein EAH89_15920 [Roseomonas nepalensis]|uniref:Uncharacterized protein n=1 Tax=Muricoccus nepalensis TaxID=1854500 RepID=A0A502FX95_9PROT|nr:hypothetical protein EAH89_15920 [Roseomonas nepalensis]
MGWGESAGQRNESGPRRTACQRQGVQHAGGEGEIGLGSRKPSRERPGSRRRAAWPPLRPAGLDAWRRRLLRTCGLRLVLPGGRERFVDGVGAAFDTEGRVSEIDKFAQAAGAQEAVDRVFHARVNLAGCHLRLIVTIFSEVY